jgi:ABC-type transporter Mla maintaining outer membrane lipid asymmetry ATPase subunit MlaF
MTSPTVPVLELHGVVKNYGGLRPLRLAELVVMPGERVAIAGLDAAGAEAVVNVITGAAVPDEGRVRVLGQLTSEVTADGWLAFLEKFGIVSRRAVLLEGATLEQNLAMPFTLDIDPVPEDVVARVNELASICGIEGESLLQARAGDLAAEIRMRAHLARAVALEPALLLLEHPSADLPEAARARFGAGIARVAETRQLAALAITNDEPFAAAMAHRRFQLDPATGRLSAPRRKGWWR